MWKHKSEIGYNKTYAVEKVIDTLEQGPNMNWNKKIKKTIFIL